MSFRTATIDVSQRVNGEFKKVGEMTIHCPTLQDCLQFMTAPVKMEEGKEVTEEGVPVYESAEANWIQGAILAAVKAQARNKLVPKTATLKDGLKIPESWADLTAEGTRGQGEGLAIAREAKAAFEEWLAKQGISEAAQNTLKTLFSNKAALMLQPAEVRAKVQKRVEDFANGIEDTSFLERIQRPVQAVLDACAGTDLGDL